MIENKRFTFKHFDWLQWHIYKDGDFFIEITNCEEDAKKLCDLLNELHEENKKLKIKKERYERLSEIREQEINNRILSLKEFIENCHNDAVKKALTNYFYSTVNEYDLSAKYRRLKKENKELKKELKECKEWINSDKNDYELTLAFIKNKGYSLKDVLEYEKELKKNEKK